MKYFIYTLHQDDIKSALISVRNAPRPPPGGDGERCVTPARTATKETTLILDKFHDGKFTLK